MVGIITWHDIEDALVYKASDEFAFWSNSPEECTEWMQYDSRGRPFIITVRNGLEKVVLAWGWERSTLHDAVEWTTRKPHSSDIESTGLLKEVFATEEQMVELIKQEVRRVAEFGSYELKRQLEFLELKAAFDRVVEEWRQHLEGRDLHLLHCSELASAVEHPRVEIASHTECVMVQGDKTVRLSKDEAGWRINVQEPYAIGPEIWRFAEETVVQPKGMDIVHSSDLVEELLQALCGI